MWAARNCTVCCLHVAHTGKNRLSRLRQVQHPQAVSTLLPQPPGKTQPTYPSCRRVPTQYDCNERARFFHTAKHAAAR